MAAVLFGLLIPVFVGIVALSTDTGVLAVARAQMSTAADSASLAGAMQLATDRRLQGVTDVSPEITAANTPARRLMPARPCRPCTTRCR
jgi:Flp pilus assembly protein TadG